MMGMSMNTDSRPRVLAVDVGACGFDRVHSILTPAGYDVLPARGTAAALEAVAQDAADLVLLDISRDGDDGLAAFRRIRQELGRPSLPVLMLTPTSDREARHRALAAGVDDLLTKPLDPDELKVRVHTLLELKAHREQDSRVGGMAGERYRRHGQHRVEFDQPTPQDMQRMDLRELARSVAVRMQSEERLGPVELRYHLPQEPVMLTVNRPRLETVVEQLLANAADALEHVTDRARIIRVIVELADDFGDYGPRILIQDTGIGIFPDELQAIFAPYYTTKPPEKGAGLGLTVARALVKSMGGELTVRSRVNLGSTFTVELPEPMVSW